MIEQTESKIKSMFEQFLSMPRSTSSLTLGFVSWIGGWLGLSSHARIAQAKQVGGCSATCAKMAEDLKLHGGISGADFFVDDCVVATLHQAQSNY